MKKRTRKTYKHSSQVTRLARGLQLNHPANTYTEKEIVDFALRDDWRSSKCESSAPVSPQKKKWWTFSRDPHRKKSCCSACARGRKFSKRDPELKSIPNVHVGTKLYHLGLYPTTVTKVFRMHHWESEPTYSLSGMQGYWTMLALRQAIQNKVFTFKVQHDPGRKSAKFERCVRQVKAKKHGKRVNPWAVCHASVDGYLVTVKK